MKVILKHDLSGLLILKFLSNPKTVIRQYIVTTFSKKIIHMRVKTVYGNTD